ncbi:hypothetical protein J132_03003 [Termitomyces sp. J132]|nr:hypothetical protein H2248_012436 [Termitomyces sp. 'cryptogamus']KNZ72492.1 hypothetical protein J132_03003 [Termitomyces sp. J132]
MSTTYLTVPSTGNPTVTTHGQSSPNEDRLNRIAICGFVVIGILFVVFLYLYISPLFKERPTEHKSKESDARTATSSDAEAGNDMDPTERSTLLAWMHRRSRGRFVDITGSAHQNLEIPRPPKLEPRTNGKRVNSFFSRISAVPHLVFPSLPPPVYSTPPVPARTASDTSSKAPTKRPFLSACRMSFRSKSVFPDPEEVTSKALLDRVSLVSLGYPVDNTTKSSRCTSDNSLHASWIPRIQSPSKAILVDNARNCDSMLRVEDRPTIISEMKDEPRIIHQQVPQQALSRARVIGESDAF